MSDNDDNEERERDNKPFDAIACEGTVPGHCAMIRMSVDDRGENQIQFVYVGPIAHCPVDPHGLYVVLHPSDMANMAMVERSQLKTVN